MKILIEGLVKSGQLQRLIEEGEKRGHQIEGCYASELVIKAGRNHFDCSLRGKPFDYDLIYLWVPGKRRWEWYTACNYLNKTKNIKIVNHKVIAKDYNYYLASINDYLKQFENNLLFPESALIFDKKGVEAVQDSFKLPVILKTSEGRKGKGVFKCETWEEVYSKIKELSEDSHAFILREFIPNDGDIRVFTVGYKVVGAMKRTPTKEGEFRSNISQGGIGENFDLKNYPEIVTISEKLSEITRTEIAGVDIMINKETGQPNILEINPGPQFTGFEQYTKINAALEIIKYFESLI